MSDTPPTICVIGDVHGHLQLALCIAARWQRELRVQFEAVLLAGDVGTFTEASQLDNATRRHGRDNPCELEFLEFWSREPFPSWLRTLFDAAEDGGLGLTCPLVMVHGNHEGFEHLAALHTGPVPGDPAPIAALPVVDTGGYLRYLPSGWRCRTASGKVLGGIGGIETGQRKAKYHELAYIDERAVTKLLGQRCDLLLTHQGPAAVQDEYGSPTLDLFLESGQIATWFHGHGVRYDGVATAGPREQTLVVPLHDVAFSTRGGQAGCPGDNAWSYVAFETSGPRIVRERPRFWREYRMHHWLKTPEGMLVCPDLANAYLRR
jgi:hypothetical protein